MKSESNIRILSFLRSSVNAASMVVSGVGLVVLLGWVLNISILKSMIPNAATMKFNVALCFVLAGVSLWLLQHEASQPGKKRMGQILAGLVVIIGLLTLSEYLFNWKLSVDQLFVRDAATAPNAFPGRMSYITAICFIFSGFALVLIDTRSSQYFSAGVILLSLLSAVGYLFDYQLLYQLGGYNTPTWHTALTFFILALALFIARQSHGMIKMMMSDLIGSRTVRLLLPVTIFLIILLGWLVQQGERFGFFNSYNESAILVVLLIFIYSPLIYFYANRINQAEAKVIRLSRLYATLSQVNQTIVRSRNRDELYQTICDVVVQFGGFSLAWVGLLDEQTGDVKPVTANGLDITQWPFAAINIQQEDLKDELIATAIRTSKVVTSDNIQTDKRIQNLYDQFQKYAYRSLAAIPFRLNGKTIGVVSLVAAEAGLFKDTEEINLLKEMGLDISFAHDSMEAERAKVYMSAIVESSNDAIIAKDLNGIVTSWNPAAQNIFGYKADEMLGQPVLRLIPPKRVREEQYILNQIKQDQPVRHYETVRVRKDGTLIDVSLTISPIRNANGNIIGASKIVHDITERKQAEAEIQKLNSDLEQRVIERTTQLAAANQELEAFSYSVSHDLRAPLRGIDGWSLALLEDYGAQLDEQAHQYLDRVRSETQRMGNLIDDLLQLSRITRADMNKVQVDLSALTQAIVARLQESEPQRQIEYTVQGDLSAWGDARLLEVVLTNLLSNACKFTSKIPQARIEFGQTELDGQRAFFVRDNGAGFDMAFAKKLFSPFQRMHKASEFPGTGVGLATVQRIVHRHGGRVWAESALNAGATFYFTLEANK
jgi:PAS domain S-box-containing protein